MRKVYPSSSRQIREGRIPSRMAMRMEKDGERCILAEESFLTCEMIGCLPPLAKTILSLIYFADYAQKEFEPVLDERMIVYSCAVLDPATLPPSFVQSEDYQIFTCHTANLLLLLFATTISEQMIDLVSPELLLNARAPGVRPSRRLPKYGSYVDSLRLILDGRACAHTGFEAADHRMKQEDCDRNRTCVIEAPVVEETHP